MLNQAFAVVRHGDRLDHVPEQWVNYRHRAAFPNDTPLTSEGMARARQTGQLLKAETSKSDRPPFTMIVSSPYLRCAQTACCIAEELGGISIHFDLDLGEIFDERAMAGDVKDKRQHRAPKELEILLKPDFPSSEFERDKDNEICIRGKVQDFPESFEKARMRFCAKVNKLVKQAASELVSIVIVTHGDAVSAVLDMLRTNEQCKKVPFCGYVVGFRHVKVLKKHGGQVLFNEDVLMNTAQWQLKVSDGILLQSATQGQVEKKLQQIGHIAPVHAKNSVYELRPQITEEQRKAINEALAGEDKETQDMLRCKAFSCEFLCHYDRISSFAVDPSTPIGKSEKFFDVTPDGESAGSGCENDQTIKKHQACGQFAKWLCTLLG